MALVKCALAEAERVGAPLVFPDGSYEPWMTDALVCAEPFWALDCVGPRDPDYSSRARSSQER